MKDILDVMAPWQKSFAVFKDDRGFIGGVKHNKARCYPNHSKDSEEIERKVQCNVIWSLHQMLSSMW